MTTCTTTDVSTPATSEQKTAAPSMSDLQGELSNGRLIIEEQDILGTNTTDYIIIDLADGDDADLSAHPSIYDELSVVSDNFAGHVALTYEQPADEVAYDAAVTGRARQIEDEDDSIRELAFTGDGV